MNVSSLLKLIPEKELEFLSAQTKVDHQVKKLTGITMFRLLLFSMLNSNKASLRIMESFYHSVSFKAFANTGNRTTKFNSIRDRIAAINPNYFEKIFHLLFDKFSNLLREKDSLLCFDSTMVAISSKLVNWGMKVGRYGDKKYLKYTVGMKGSFPCHVEIFKTQQALSEEKTIPPAIFNYLSNTENIVVFDRGVQARKTFEKFTANQIRFVTRIKTDVLFKVISENKIPAKPQHTSVTVCKDLMVHLKDADSKWMATPMRLVKTTIDESTEEIYFLANIKELSAYEVAFIYKQRWQIEVFFKFLKQELNLNHMVSRNENTIRVMIYMTFILSILIIAYKKLNKLSGYKIPKLNFSHELEADIIKEIVILCGGNPFRMKHLFNDS